MAFDLAAKAESTLDKVIGVIVVLALIGGTIALMFTSLKGVVSAFSATSPTGNTTADTLAPILGLVVALFGLFGIMKLVKNAFNEA